MRRVGVKQDFGHRWKCGYISMAPHSYIVHVYQSVSGTMTFGTYVWQIQSCGKSGREMNWIYHSGSAEHAKYIKHYHMMNYDYTASDDPVSEPCVHMCFNHIDFLYRTVKSRVCFWEYRRLQWYRLIIAVYRCDNLKSLEYILILIVSVICIVRC